MLPGWQRVEVGDVGQAISPLRPSGKMQVGDFTVDVVTEGDFVERGQRSQSDRQARGEGRRPPRLSLRGMRDGPRYGRSTVQKSV